MPPKRKHHEPTAITYGAAIPWLHTLLNPSSTIETWLDASTGSLIRHPSLPDSPDLSIATEAAKIDYLLHHQLSKKASLLQALGLERGMEKFHDVDKHLNLKQSQWKGAILNKFLLSHVQELVRQWHVAHAWCSFKMLGEEERRQIWLEAYDAEPKRVATTMFKPVIGVLDIENVFREELESDEDRARMRAVRVMLRDKYLLGCEITYTHRILVNKKDACFDQWTSYTEDSSLASTSVAVADLPIVSQLSAEAPSTPPAKRPKVVLDI